MPRGEQWIARYDQTNSMLLQDCVESILKISIAACFANDHALAKSQCGCLRRICKFVAIVSGIDKNADRSGIWQQIGHQLNKFHRELDGLSRHSRYSTARLIEGRDEASFNRVLGDKKSDRY